jgi:hypothetical protein
MKKVRAVLSITLLAASMLFAVPRPARAECIDGVTTPVPWDPYLCAPFVFVDCSVCTVNGSGPGGPLNPTP